MPAPRKYDTETRDRAVRMYRDRINEHGDTKVAARRHVGALIDVNPDTLRNWIDREKVDTGTAAELKALRKGNAELRRANEILKTASAFFAAAEVDRRLR